ncbi:MAG: hypothetical protein A2806_04240 [Candidatus Terrybacteria bacterium RIFCSPHIGHO2_01_FULL_48_17]|uniref:AI-2E family transporter n=1 Tax=Candidatus Terrybacteria bacterium RIFCSPHIGHO2_01_FULL_48_17 TaxID=1802362 RepID=A0A1G2PKJ6_9BACT|nr:MAG: hypothetical protein A2806_04240 [Candidatus Terrybacteria bacterium RIFCSPHIGHO2_01_FULL_48_17]
MSLDIPTKTIVRVFAALFIVALVLVLKDILALFFLALVVASGLSPVIGWMERRGFPRILAVTMLFVGAALFIAGLFWLLIPPILEDISELSKNFPLYAELLRDSISRFGIAPEGAVGVGVSEVFREFANYFGKGVTAIPAIVFQFFGGIIALLSFVLVTFYLALERDGVERFLKAIAPGEEPYVVDLWRRAQRKIGYWARGQAVLMIVIGLVTYAGLSVLGVRYALLLAVLAGLLEVVQLVGPIVAGTVATIVAFSSSPLLAVGVVLLYVAIQQIESNILVPVVFKKALGLSPVVVIFALLAGAKLGGVVGMIIAVPLVAILSELLSDFSKGKIKL